MFIINDFPLQVKSFIFTAILIMRFMRNTKNFAVIENYCYCSTVSFEIKRIQRV